MQQQVKKQVISLFVGQVGAALIAIAVCSFFGAHEALSATFGAWVLLMANLFFAVRFFGSNNYRAHSVVMRFYTGAIFKWLVMIVGFIVAVHLGLSWWGFLVGFLSVQMGFYLAPLFFAHHTDGVNV